MRRHPVLGFMKLHKGTDFAAPIGTRIHAAGDGVVVFAAMKGANGNLTILRHDNGWLTYYLHQNRFSPGIAAGVRVRQGQEIGEVSTTGRSTGPHLHYEVHIDGQPVNSLTLADNGGGRSLSAGALAAFVKERDRIDAARAKSGG
ncbi:M23 family metallopeptidase [Sphingomonas sp. MMS24-JH45]